MENTKIGGVSIIKNYVCFLIISFILFGCSERDRKIEVELTFKGTGNGEFEICFSESGNDDFHGLNYHLYATTANGLKRDVERSIFQECESDNMFQFYKVGAYTKEEIKEVQKYFVPGNIKHVKVEIFYDGEYKTPFLVKEFENL